MANYREAVLKVFISSLIAGFEPFRAAARTAVTTLRYEPIMAEDFGARPHSPQVACLTGLRGADAVVLILGERYGAVQAGSGLSATHEEYRDARGRKPVIAFVQEGITPEPAQAAFIAEVQGWEGGLFRGAFRDATDLQAGVIGALHDYKLASAVGPVDSAALVARAKAMLAAADQRGRRNGGPTLILAIAGGPSQQILRPIEIEDAGLHDRLAQEGLFGANRIFDLGAGLAKEIDKDALVLSQDSGTELRLDEQGSIFLRLSVQAASDRRQFNGIPILIEEVVQRQIGSGLAYAAAVLEAIDPTQRLTHLGFAAQLAEADHLGWRTQREQDASPNSGPMRMGYGEEPAPVTDHRPRAVLRLNRAQLVEDILVPLRRRRKG